MTEVREVDVNHSAHDRQQFSTIVRARMQDVIGWHWLVGLSRPAAALTGAIHIFMFESIRPLRSQKKPICLRQQEGQQSYLLCHAPTSAVRYPVPRTTFTCPIADALI